MKKTKYLIIGSSAAALGCIKAIRKNDKTGEITVVSKDSNIIYSRPVIAEVLSGKFDEMKMIYTLTEKFIKENNLKFLHNTIVKQIEADNNCVITESNEKISYEKLLIATGGKPIIPDLKQKGNVNDKIFTFTNIQDLAQLTNQIKQIKSAVVVGAGFIGLEVADAFIKNDIQTTIVEFADRILIRGGDVYISKIVEKQFTDKTAKIITKDSIEAVEEFDDGLKLILKSGILLETDIVVFCIGVKPDLSLIQNTKIKTAVGIIINENCETTVKNIYAAGDVAEIKDIISDKNFPIALWIWAYQTGFTAGDNMSGGKSVFDGGYAMSPLKFSDIPIIAVGDISIESAENICLLNEKKNIYQKIFIENNIIKGFILTGATVEKAGLLAKIMKKKYDVSKIKDKLTLADFGLADIPVEWRNENE